MAEHEGVPLRPLMLRGQTTPASSTQYLLEEGTYSAPSSRPGTPTAARRSLHVQFERAFHDKPVSAWHRFIGRGQRVPTWWESVASLRSHTSVNLLFIFLPLAWASHLLKVNGHEVFGAPARFTCASSPRDLVPALTAVAVNLLAIIPLQKRFEWLGDEMIPYIGAVRTVCVASRQAHSFLTGPRRTPNYNP